jgi:hypothetical protein
MHTPTCRALPTLVWALALTLQALLCQVVRAHDSPLPSATLVQRDGGHFTLSLRWDAARALQLTLLPDTAPTEALALLSAMEPERFAKHWEQATRRWAEHCALLIQGRSHKAERWSWPTASDAQAWLQRQLMPQLTGAHADHEWLAAQAEFRIGGDAVTQAQLKLPAALRPLSLTSLRPRQQWAREGDRPLDLRF